MDWLSVESPVPDRSPPTKAPSAVRKQPTKAADATHPATTPPPASYVPRLQFAGLGQDKTEPIIGIRKAMAKAMIRAQAVPHFCYSDEV